MFRISLILAFFLSFTPVYASLHPGWEENGWLTDLDTAQIKAQKYSKPIFLYFDAIWCSWCQVYKQKTLDKPQIQQKLKQDYVALVLDYDAKPQLFSQLEGRGLPFNVIMDSQGNVLNRFVGLLSVEDLLLLLNKFNQPSSPEQKDEFDMFEPVTVTSLEKASYIEFRKAFLQHLEALYSKQHNTLAGFYESGITLKRPSPLTWIWLMDQKEWKQRAKLAAEVEARHLWDTADGGFFQYLQRTPPLTDYLETSKLLEVNARLAQWIARSAGDSKALRDIAGDAVNYLLNKLHDEKTRGFFQSQLADQHYYQLPLTERKKQNPPPVDKVIRMDTNAQTIMALVDLAHSLQDPRLIQYAAETYQFLISNMENKGQRYHLYVDGNLEHKAELSDESWLLAAGLLLQSVSYDVKRQLFLKQLTRSLQRQIDSINETPAEELPEQDTLGIIAWIATFPHPAKQNITGLPARYAHWALKQIRLEPDTPPDSLIFALRAWESLLIPVKTDIN